MDTLTDVQEQIGGNKTCPASNSPQLLSFSITAHASKTYRPLGCEHADKHTRERQITTVLSREPNVSVIKAINSRSLPQNS